MEVTMKCKKIKKVVLDVNDISDYDNVTLQSLIDRLKEKGITDLTTVKLVGNYSSCCCDEYCYCSSKYENIRIEIV